jgi:Calcineurin-like phosphoesterase
MEETQTAIEVQVCSDVHLDEDESIKFHDVITPSAPVLIIAGDLGDPFAPAYEAFLADCSREFEHVYLVPGNHEYHNGTGMTMAQTDAHLAALCAGLGNVTFLNCGKARLRQNVTILGLTLWSHVPRALWDDAARLVSDYFSIPGHTPARSNALHGRHLAWLVSALDEAKRNQDRVIVVTHHAPSMVGVSPRCFERDPLRFCYRNSLDHLVSRPENLMWVCGHTHYSFRYKRGKTLFLANQFKGRVYDKACKIRI